MTEEIKPCPLCGRAPYSDFYIAPNDRTDTIQSWRLICNSPQGTSSPHLVIASGDGESKDAAIAAWNMRYGKHKDDNS